MVLFKFQGFLAIWIALEVLCTAFCSVMGSGIAWRAAPRVLQQASPVQDAECSVVQDVATLEAAVLAAKEGTMLQVCLAEAEEGSSCVSSQLFLDTRFREFTLKICVPDPMPCQA